FMSRLMRMIGQNCAHHEACLRLFADWEKDGGITSGMLPLRLGRGISAKLGLGSCIVERGFGCLSTT
ncbi:MAG: hypothetical protein EBX06_13185, partial [Rhodobacteraceae bacterium]|nr:hypothetical protein [Paracoccaceae bacterium]